MHKRNDETSRKSIEVWVQNIRSLFFSFTDFTSKSMKVDENVLSFTYGT